MPHLHERSQNGSWGLSTTEYSLNMSDKRSAKRKRVEAESVDANEAITFELLSCDITYKFKPLMSHQLFGDEETILGHKNASARVIIQHDSFRNCIEFGSDQQAPGATKVTANESSSLATISRNLKWYLCKLRACSAALYGNNKEGVALAYIDWPFQSTKTVKTPPVLQVKEILESNFEEGRVESRQNFTISSSTVTLSHESLGEAVVHRPNGNRSTLSIYQYALSQASEQVKVHHISLARSSTGPRSLPIVFPECWFLDRSGNSSLSL